MARRLEQIEQWRQRQQQQPPAPAAQPAPETPEQPVVKPSSEPPRMELSEMATARMPQRFTYADTGHVPSPAMPDSYRQEALAAMGEDEFRRNAAKMNASDKEYWAAQLEKDPGNIYVNTAHMLASDETPAEREKRERRERIGRGIAAAGNLIGHAANLYFNAKGAVPVRFGDPRIGEMEERRRQLEEQKDRILLAAKQAYLRQKQARADRKAEQEAAAAAAADDRERFELELQLKRGQLAQRAKEAEDKRKADEAGLKEKTRHNKEMEKRYGSAAEESGTWPVMTWENATSGKQSPKKYDLNKDEDVLEYYREGAALGMWPDILHDEHDGDFKPDMMDIDLLRNIILYHKNNAKTAKQSTAPLFPGGNGNGKKPNPMGGGKKPNPMN